MKLVKAIFKSLLTVSFSVLISTSALFAQGNALSLDGSTSSTFTNPVSGDFTIEFWIKTELFSGSEGNWYNGTGLVDGEVAGITYDFGVSLTNGKIAFGVGDSSAQTDQTLTSSITVSDGKWHHVAAVRTLSTGEMKLYIDGILNGSATCSTHLLTAPENLAIGKLQTDINYFNGLLDEIRIWDKPLTQSEINGSLTAELSGNETNLVSYWKFNETEGNLSNDETNGGRNLTFNGSPVFVTSGAFTLPAFINSGIQLDGNHNSEVAWGDYDNDGDMDFAISGENYGAIYRNDGNSVFSKVNTDLRSAYSPSLAWTDIDLDGNLDLINVGPNGMYVYKNDGNGGFSEIKFSDVSENISMIALGDMDDDGDEDLFVSGSSSSSSNEDQLADHAIIFKNSKGTYVPFNENLPVAYRGASQWVDFDNDGDLDLFYTGSSGGGSRVLKLYKNDGSGNLTDFPTDIVPMARANSAWADLDNDGDPDLIMMGTPSGNGNQILAIYQNDNGVFTDTNADLTNIFDGEISCLDYDHDGDLDFILAGRNSSNNSASLAFKNNGELSFSYDSDISLPQIQGWYGENASVISADIDNDGDLDLLFDGASNNEYSNELFIMKNTSTASYTEPTVPETSLMSSVEGNSVALSWGASSDNLTTQSDISYTVKLVDSHGKNYTTLLSDEETGRLKVPKPGNAGFHTSLIVKHLPKGEYFWKVQAIDHDLQASDFSDEQNFTITSDLAPEAPTGLTVNSPENGVYILSWNPNSEANLSHYEVYGGTNSNPTELIDTTSSTSFPLNELSPGTTYYFRVVAVDSIGLKSEYSIQAVFTPNPFNDYSANLNSNYNSTSSWADFDRDGDLDLMIAGENGIYLYSNDDFPNESFKSGKKAKISEIAPGRYLNYYTNLGNLTDGTATWVDSDNDGDLDIIVAGSNGEVSGIRLFINTGEGFNETFIDELYLDGGNVTTGDIDNDGDIDLFITGDSNSGRVAYFYSGRVAYFYKNNGDNNFERLDNNFQGVYWSTSNLVDYDHDGDLDLFYAGPMGNENGLGLFLYKNDGTGKFTEVPYSTHHIGDLTRSSSSWSDYDNDGDLDLLFIGRKPGEGNAYAFLYKNNGDDSFTALDISFGRAYSGSVSWGDFDNDGDSDILISGYSEGLNENRDDYITSIYKNNGNDSFSFQDFNLPGFYSGSEPGKPYSAFGDFDNDGDLDLELSGSSNGTNTSTLFENSIGATNSAPSAPTGTDQAVDKNAVVFSWNNSEDDHTASAGLTYNIAVWDSNGTLIVSPNSEMETGKRFLANKGNGVSKLRRLSPGKYYWFVQAIDASFSGSSFSEVNNFVITQGLPPEAPQNLRASTNYETNHVELNWNSNSEGSLSFYKIYISSESNTEAVLDSTGDTYYEVINLNAATVYRFRITAVDTSGNESEFSTEALGKPNYFVSEQTSLPAFDNGNIQLGDYDKDGDLDVLISGYKDGFGNVAEIWENHQDGFSFSSTGISFSFNTGGSAQFADLDNDGFLDVIIGGFSGEGISESNSQLHIYLNTNIEGSRQYEEWTGHGIDDFESNHSGSISWGDYNIDGWNDIFVTGRNSAGVRMANLYRSNGDGTFTTVQSFNGVYQSTSNFVDFNNDGWPDIFYSGAVGNQNKFSALLKNNGDGSFTEMESTTIPQVARGSSEWADYDHDGDQDLLLTGYSVDNEEGITGIFRNNSDNTFTKLNADMEPTVSGKAVWGDIDNDGDFDVILTGGKIGINSGPKAVSGEKTEKTELILINQNPNITAVYQNLGEDTFVNFPEDLIPLGNNSSVTVGDIDTDGDLDFIVSGYFTYGGLTVLGKTSNTGKKANKSNEIPIGNYRTTQLYSNPSETPNNIPSAPASVSAVASSDSGNVTITWDMSSDLETPSSGLSYNVAVWTNEGNPVVSILSDTATGFMYLPQYSNAGQRTEITLTNVPEGHYYISVQAIDAGFAGSEFSEPVAFNLVYNVPVELSSFEAAVNQTGGVNLRWVTASETNNAGWEIEYRQLTTDNGQQKNTEFRKVGFVAGKGTTTEQQIYSFNVQRLSAVKMEFRLKQLDLDGKFNYSKSVEVEIEKPVAFALGQNYPNPFNPKTIIPYSVPSKVKVSIKLYDILGRELKVLENSEREAGNYFVELNGANLSSGVYIYKIEAGAFSSTKKLFLMK